MLGFIFMTSLIDRIFKKKSVPYITVLDEQTREGLHKSYIPRFLYKPPYGFPRFANLPYVRWLSTTPYVDMCITTIVDEVTSLPWDIIVNPDLPDELFRDKEGDLNEESLMEMAHIKSFFMNPNTNKESFEDVFIKMPVRDMLEVNSGILNKVFNLKEEMVEIVARDGITFTKNPDIHGMITDRDDILVTKNILPNRPSGTSFENDLLLDPFNNITPFQARDRAAYFQFGWIAGPKPTPYGKREIVWLQKMHRTDDLYAYSPVQILAKTLQMLLWQIDSDLEYYNNNNVPKGIIGIDGGDSGEIEAFKEQWKTMQHEQDEFGNQRKIYNSVPILNQKPTFQRIEFSSSEMDIIEKQKWYTKMVWASFGVTATELGYTEDAQGQANQIVQSKVFRKKAILPIITVLENRYNAEIVSEFEYTSMKKVKGGSVEVPKYLLKWKMFDTDEERKKYELYKLQTEESGLMTINEIRKIEGQEPLDWGEEDPRKKQDPTNSFNFGGGGFGNPKDDEKNVDKDKGPGKEPGSRNPDENQKKKEKELNNKEGKAEESNFQTLIKIFKDFLESQKKNILDELERQVGKDIIKNLKSDPSKVEVKALEDVIKKIGQLVSFQGLKGIVNEFIKNNFNNGVETVEKDLDRNFVPDNAAIKFLSEHTFDNIKGMTDDISNKLKTELQRGLINGEGIDKLRNRVNSVFDVGKNRAEMIARTETNRAENLGKLNAMNQSGEPAKKWILITLDNRTSNISKAMDRKYGSPEKAIPLNENFSVDVGGKTFEGPAPPFHPNDRDVVMFTVSEE